MSNALHTAQSRPDYSALTGYGPRPFTPKPLVRGDWIVIDPRTSKECARALTEAGAVKAAITDGLTADAVRFVGQAERAA